MKINQLITQIRHYNANEQNTDMIRA